MSRTSCSETGIGRRLTIKVQGFRGFFGLGLFMRDASESFPVARGAGEAGDAIGLIAPFEPLLLRPCLGAGDVGLLVPSASDAALSRSALRSFFSAIVGFFFFPDFSAPLVGDVGAFVVPLAGEALDDPLLSD